MIKMFEHLKEKAANHMIKLECPKCGLWMDENEDGLFTRQVKCPACNEVFQPREENVRAGAAAQPPGWMELAAREPLPSETDMTPQMLLNEIRARTCYPKTRTGIQFQLLGAGIMVIALGILTFVAAAILPPQAPLLLAGFIFFSIWIIWRTMRQQEKDSIAADTADLLVDEALRKLKEKDKS